LQKSLAQQENTIAVLAGAFPGAYQAAPYRLTDFTLPKELPVSLPAALVWQRPDVRSAEALMHQASAKIGVATANMLPKFTLSASLPTTAGEIGDMFAKSSSGWALAASVAQTVFDGGTLLHTKRAAVATYEEAYQTYRSSVLTAFKDVANALRALEHDDAALKGYYRAEQAAKDSLDLSRAQFRAGTGAYTDVLSAQNTYQSARVKRASAEADRYLDAITLFEALGGGWWNRPDNLVQKANTDPSDDAAAPLSGDTK
jgi:NodT family efflux transporter outer membrane factor (OMF) lipoprotein